jgi:uncharacterized membrane protein
VPVDVHTEVKIARPRHDVAVYACDPDNAPAWYENVESVRWLSERPLAVGSRVEFTASFLGRRRTHAYEVLELLEGERFVMRSSQGPLPIETTYTFHDAPDGATVMALRNRSEPAGFARLTSAVIARAIARANNRDLRRLRRLLTSR